MANNGGISLPVDVTFSPGWPQFVQTWQYQDYVGGEYPMGRGTAAINGWQCPGCGSCYSPFVSACWQCPGTVTATGANQPAPPEPQSGADCHCCPEDP